LYCISTPIIFRSLIRLASIFRSVLPKTLSRQLPAGGQFNLTSKRPSKRKVVLLNGCVQNTLSPATNDAAIAVLSRLNISVQEIEQESCCGALHYHSDYAEMGKRNARKLLSQLEVALDEGAETVVSTASGCGTFLKHYSSLFKNDTSTLEVVRKINHRVMDIGEFIAREDIDQLKLSGSTQLAFHSPCTLKHGQELNEVTESLLSKLGIQLEQTRDSHLCCGSAGTYSLFQPTMSKALKKQKLEALGAESVDKIATANIGCQCHLASGTDKPVRHWIEFVAELLPK
jgi:glycolate oxidase iron-sulfur subunit